MNEANYNCIDKYIISAVCKEPLHVGSASDDKSEVLIHPVTDIPFIQATGLCGAIRGYCNEIAGEEITDTLFGSKKNDQESKVKVSDGIFDEGLCIELRPHVRIDPETGTASSSVIKGEGEVKSGQKFDMQYVAAGAKFSFEIYLYGASDEERNLLLKALSAMDAGELQIGGQKSNGCGYIGITKVLHGKYDMNNADDRNNWISESGMEDESLPGIEASDFTNAYEITVDAETEGELLVKGIAVNEFGKDAPKAVNIQNASGEYIIPGSSIKGTIRSRMEMIAEYMQLNPELIDEGFGKASEKDETGMIGNLKFRDIVVGDKEGKDINLRTRIRIDKFTGGVRNGALFSELNVSGDLKIQIQIADHNDPEAVAGLLLLALRDLGYKLYALGGGQNVGKGYINIKAIIIEDKKDGKKCCLDQTFKVTDGQDVLDQFMARLKDQSVA